MAEEEREWEGCNKKEKISILGCHPNWVNVKNVSGNAIAISLYQSGPLEVMGVVLYGFLMNRSVYFDGHGDIPHLGMESTHKGRADGLGKRKRERFTAKIA